MNFKTNISPLLTGVLLFAVSEVHSANSADKQAPPPRAIPELPYKLKHHHIKDGTYANNYLEHPKKGFTDLMKWRFSRKKPTPSKFPVYLPDLNLLNYPDTNETLTWIGHSGFIIQTQGLTILTDPHLSERASPASWAGPARYTPAPLKVQELPHIDVVIISHDHYDHLDLNTIQDLNQHQKYNPPLYLAPLGIGDWLKKQGATNVVELDWWENYAFKGFRFYALPVQHWCRRSPWDLNERLWAGWAMESNSRIIYFAGDAGYSEDFKDTGRFLNRTDLTLMPIGAYAPRWFMKPYHMNPEEAVKAALDVNSDLVVGMHFGTFELTDEDYKEPQELLKKALQEKELSEDWFITLPHGRTHIWKDKQLSPSQPNSLPK
jgi:L-ascorbate metabolism protein UlaG (beta-lactamase superfamily)